MRILLLSDPHWDFYASNEARAYYHQDVGELDVVAIAGDVANSSMLCEEFFDLMEECFSDVPVRVAVPGNHDMWYGPPSRTPNGEKGFHQIAREHGFVVPAFPENRFEIVHGILLFNIFYKHGLSNDEIAFTNDNQFFPVREHEVSNDPADWLSFNEARVKYPKWRPDTPDIQFSMSHIVPRKTGIPSRYNPRHPMFYNDDIDMVLRHYNSFLHLYGHDHEYNDVVVDGVRYVNTAIGYSMPVAPLSHLVVET